VAGFAGAIGIANLLAAPDAVLASSESGLSGQSALARCLSFEYCFDGQADQKPTRW
jgi:hypothetical protein